MDHAAIKKFFVYKIQYFSQAQVKDFKKDVLEVLNSSTSENYITGYHRQNFTEKARIEEDGLRIWHLDPRENLQSIFDNCREECKKTTSYDYKIPFKGEFLEKFPDKTLEGTNVAETDYVFIEFNEGPKKWSFTHADVPTLEKCEGCYGCGLLKYPCACERVSFNE